MNARRGRAGGGSPLARRRVPDRRFSGWICPGAAAWRGHAPCQADGHARAAVQGVDGHGHRGRCGDALFRCEPELRGGRLLFDGWGRINLLLTWRQVSSTKEVILSN